MHLANITSFFLSSIASAVYFGSFSVIMGLDKLNMELRHHCAPCFGMFEGLRMHAAPCLVPRPQCKLWSFCAFVLAVPRAHASQTAEQLPDARVRQLQLQEELRQQIEEKRRLEAERREQERLEEEALLRRVAEQQARLQAEYERDEKLRREREIQVGLN